MKGPKNVKSDSKMNGSDGRLLADSRRKGEELNRGCVALVVFCKRDGRSFNSNVHHG